MQSIGMSQKSTLISNNSFESDALTTHASS